MSYDINFWKQSAPTKLSPEQIYHKLCEGEVVEGLAVLPIDQILSQVQAEFPNFDPGSDFPSIELEDCGIEVSTSQQHVRFDIRGEIGDSANKLVAIMTSFGCPMYDPQVNKRYDKKRGMEVGKPPRFDSRSTTQKVIDQEARQQVAAKILSQIEAQRVVKSVDQLTQEEAQFIELERGFWLSDWDFYRENLAENVFFVFPQPVGVIGRALIEGMIQCSPSLRWAEVSINDIRVSQVHAEMTLVIYRAQAWHTKEEPPYRVTISSLYVNEGGKWKLTFHQQTPDLVEELIRA